jgi:2-keto-4-pentenoate hydratase/2-oxohepta-3-ene-1,7-dioic acid hydratase in catechol pathway
MQFVSFRRIGQQLRAGIMVEHGIIDIHEGMALMSDERPSHPLTLGEIIAGNDDVVHLGNVSMLAEVMAAQQVGEELVHWYGGIEMMMRRDDVSLVAPLPQLAAWRRSAVHLGWHQRWLHQRGEHLPVSWYERPPLWAALSNAWYGDRQVVPFPATRECDVECELLWVLGHEVRDVDPLEAQAAIMGVTLMATIVARDIGEQDVIYGLAARPVGAVMGPTLMTLDELSEFILSDGRLHVTMQLLVEDEVCGHVQLRDMDYAMADVVAHASRGVTLPAGSVFSSGTLLSLPVDGGRWLVPGDEVCIDAGPMGTLRWSMEAW